ncbi:MAG: crossover junction endodeoxyribonuclease RuvC [Oscillospiraceae bacterium]|nr:crossover junction endodeoxyribonuclease RuvC [Oscillospiraceae bacterium]
MRVLGIDPGYATVGYGVIDYDKAQFRVINYGAITTGAHIPFERRLSEIHSDLCEIIKAYTPSFMAVERLFFTTNQKTAIDVSQARGVILLAAVNNGIEIAEYTPLQVKQSVTGYGKAVKTQVQEMTKRILKLPAIPKPDDTADALAIAVCHAHTHSSERTRVFNNGIIKKEERLKK